MAKYLDEHGLSTLKDKIKAACVRGFCVNIVAGPNDTLVVDSTQFSSLSAARTAISENIGNKKLVYCKNSSSTSNDYYIFTKAEGDPQSFYFTNVSGNVVRTLAIGSSAISITTTSVGNVKPDWNAATGSADEILNKPTIPSSPSDIGAATSAQGAKADTAVQPDDVARTGYVDVPGGQCLCFRLDNTLPLRYGSIAILSSHATFQILDLLSFNHKPSETDPLADISLKHVAAGKEEYQKSKVYWTKNASYTYIYFYFGNNGYHRVSYILTGQNRYAGNLGIYVTTGGLPSGTTELTSETYVPKISGTVGTAAGATNQPVFVDSNGNITACNVFYA